MNLIRVQNLKKDYVNEDVVTQVLHGVSFGIERALWGLNPFVFHLDNILLHILCAVLVLVLGRRMGLSEKGALIAALIFAFAAALIVNFFLAGLAAWTAGLAAATVLITGLALLTLAQRAFCAAAILALPAALMPPFFGAGVAATALAVDPSTWLSSFSKAAIFSLRSAAWRSCWTDKLIIELMAVIESYIAPYRQANSQRQYGLNQVAR